MTSLDDRSPAAPPPSTRTERRRALVEEEILERAAALFAERGYPGTSLQDVAESLGMSRTALYYYIPSKEAILGRLVENLSARDAASLEVLRQEQAGSPAERLREMARTIAHSAASNPAQTRILTENRHHLPPELRETDRAAERSILRSFEGVIAEGVLAGVFRAVSPRSAALSIIGMCLWTAWWAPAAVRVGSEEIAAQVADQALLSVEMGQSGLDRADPAALILAVRENLAQLEQVIDG
jgi:AcrR family transcriptional regulator